MKKNSFGVTLVTCIFCSGWMISSSQAVELVQNRQAVSVIVVPDQTMPVVEYAAKELQYHVQQATGATVPIVVERNRLTSSKGYVYLGACRETIRLGIDTEKLAPNSFIMKTDGVNLFIYGNDAPGDPLGDGTSAGTLFGVYEFLETVMKVHWLWPGKLGEVIPDRSDLAIESCSQTVVPKLLHTRLRPAGVYSAMSGWSSPEIGKAYLRDETIWLRRHRFARGISLEYGHGFIKYWDRFSKTHPEYFNLLPDGRRISDPMYLRGAGSLISLNVSEPALWNQIVKDWKHSRTPVKSWINCAENDTCGRCVCSECLSWDVCLPGQETAFKKRAELARSRFLKHDPAWYEALGSLSDRYARFYLAVQKLAEKTDPEAIVLGYAYANYNEPPMATTLNDRIVIAIVPSLMFPWTDEKRQAFREQWEGWARAGVRVYLRPNYTLDGHNLPIFYADKLGEDISFAYKRNMIATDFDSLTGQWATQGPNLYVLARMHLHGDWPVSKMLDEYYDSFGKAAPAIREYFAYWKGISDHVTEDTLREALQKDPAGGFWSKFHRVAYVIFTPKVLEHGFKILMKAKELAKGDDLASQRVHFLEKGLRNAELTLQTQEAYATYKATGQIQSFRTAIERLDAFRKSTEAENIANMGFLAWAENGTWDRSLLKLMKVSGEPLGKIWKFAWDPDDQGMKQKWQSDEFDSSAWEDISVESAYGQQAVGQRWRQEHGKDYLGVVWYRIPFSIKPENKSKQIRLIFGAVDEACKIWVNGKMLLDRPFPFRGNSNSWQEAFEVDISQVVRLDRPNTLAVQVENNFGDGGIWKPVYLIISDFR
jgi:hypothetical protein